MSDDQTDLATFTIDNELFFLNPLGRGQNLTLKRFAAIQAPNRQALVDYLRPMMMDGKTITFTDPCGAAPMLTVHDIDDIPAESVPSTCGNADHWFIKYEETGNDHT